MAQENCSKIEESPLILKTKKYQKITKEKLAKFVSIGQSATTTFFLRHFISSLTFAPFITIVVVLVCGFSNNVSLYFACSILQCVLLLFSFNKNWSFLLGSLTVENPFMTFIPNVAIITSSAIRVSSASSSSSSSSFSLLPIYMLNARENSANCLSFWSLLFATSSILMALIHYIRIRASFRHVKLGMHHAGYDVYPYFGTKSRLSSFSQYFPTVYELMPFATTTNFFNCTSPKIKCFKNVVYSKVLIDKGVSGVAPIQREFFNSKTNELSMTCDVYVKEGCNSKNPDGSKCLLYIHGGAWILGAKDLGVITPLINRAAMEGWIVISMDYQLCPYVAFPDFILDCYRAISFIRDTTNGLSAIKGLPTKVDTSFIVVGGDSAGGHICNLLALMNPKSNSSIVLPDILVNVDLSIQGVIDMYGPTDAKGRNVDIFQHIVIGKPFEESSIQAFKDASPIDYLHDCTGEYGGGGTTANDVDRKSVIKETLLPSAVPNLPKYWICFHGTADGLVPIQDGRRYYNIFFQNVAKASAAAPFAFSDESSSNREAVNFYSTHKTAQKGYGSYSNNSFKGLDYKVRIEMVGSFHGFTGFYCMRTKVCMDAVAIMLNEIDRVTVGKSKEINCTRVEDVQITETANSKDL